MCGTGVKQGDPLASVLFCLGLQDALDSIHRRFPRCIVLADMDDVTVLGPTADMPEIVRSFATDISRLGMTLNTRKCQILNLHEDASNSIPGLRIMGAYIGSDTYQEQKLREAFQELQDTVDRVATEEPAVALPVTKFCLNARPVYLARTTRPDLLMMHAESFDRHVDSALLRIAGHALAAMPEVSSSLRTLRVSEGGLGMHRINDIKAAAYTASMLTSLTNLFVVMPRNMIEWRSRNIFAALHTEMEIMSDYAPEWISRQRNGQLTIPSWPDNAPIAQGAEMDPMLIPDPIEVPDAPSQRTLVAPIREHMKASIHEALRDDRHALAWWRSGSYPNAAAWTRPSPIATLNLGPSEYRTALGLRLLLPARGTPEGAYLQCSICGTQDKVNDYRYHALNCRRTCDARTQRHTAVKQALAELLSSLFGQAAVSLETPLGPNLRVPDITLTLGTQVKIIDTCVVNPTAERYATPGADPPPAGHAAAKAEQRKRAAYATSLAARNLAPATLVPFAIETTGRFGAAADAFLESLPLLLPAAARDGNLADTVAFHKARLRVIAHRGNARAFAAYAPHLLTVQQPSPAASVASSTSDAIY
jgi:hypothetical protein